MSGISVDAFFDEPGLLSVRLSRPAPPAAVRQFAARPPDHAPAPQAVPGRDLAGTLATGGIVLTGILVVGFGICMVNGTGRPVQAAYDRPTSDGEVEADTRPVDAGGSAAWAQTLDRLADDLQPVRDDLRPFAVRTLLDVPKDLHAQGGGLPAWMQPAASPGDHQAHDRARRLAERLAVGGASASTAIILDLPGSQSVAAAAGLGQVGDAVFTMDNLPHERGVVPAGQTLAAAIYWRPEILRGRSPPPGRAMPVFVLDAHRLDPYDNAVDRFDNRSRARLPSAAALRALGVSSVIYVRPSQAELGELDDVNAIFVAYAAAGLSVHPLGLDSADAGPGLVGSGGPMGVGPGGYFPFQTTYQPVLRPIMTSAAPFDGGVQQRGSVLGHLLAASPPSHPSLAPSTGSRSSSGGSWARFFSSSGSSFGG